MTNRPIEPIVPDHRQALQDLDRMMAEYREALKDPNSEESRQQRIADEIFGKPVHLFD